MLRTDVDHALYSLQFRQHVLGWRRLELRIMRPHVQTMKVYDFTKFLITIAIVLVIGWLASL